MATACPQRASWRHVLHLHRVEPIHAPRLFYVSTVHLGSDPDGVSPAGWTVEIHVHSRLWEEAIGTAACHPGVVMDLELVDSPLPDPCVYRCEGKVYSARETDTGCALGVSCGGLLCVLTTAHGTGPGAGLLGSRVWLTFRATA
jgi:hypothetical protein